MIRASKKKRINAKILGFESKQPIICEDHLTPKSKENLFKAKSLQKMNELASVWTRDGNVYIKETLDGRSYKINSQAELKAVNPTQTLEQTGIIDKDNQHTTKDGKKRTLEQRSPDNLSQNQNRSIKKITHSQEGRKPTPNQPHRIQRQHTLEEFKLGVQSPTNVAKKPK